MDMQLIEKMVEAFYQGACGLAHGRGRKKYILTQGKLTEEPRCWYCDKQECDHRHGSGHSCMHCCSMHGMVIIDCNRAYDWIEECLKAKNERIAQAEWKLAVITEDRDRWKQMHENAMKEARLAESEITDVRTRYEALKVENLGGVSH